MCNYIAMSKPARLQVDPDTITDDDKPPQTGHTFNIWYLKWAGGDSSSRNTIKLKFRVNIKRDAGYTKAAEHTSPICLFFARGCCYRGRKCPYLHRLPKITDLRLPTQDCFGRDKTTDYRDDMGGVGLLGRRNRTLFVGGLHMGDDVDGVVSRHFLEFGAIDKIKVVYSKSCAFVTYKLEAEAQFAKEAMDAQSLDGNEVLSVRWANEDPNPNNQDLDSREVEQASMDAVRALLKDTEYSGSKKRPRVEKSDTKQPDADPAAEQPDINVADEAEDQEDGGILGAARVRLLKKIAGTKAPLPSPAPSLHLAGYSSD